MGGMFLGWGIRLFVRWLVCSLVSWWLANWLVSWWVGVVSWLNEEFPVRLCFSSLIPMQLFRCSNEEELEGNWDAVSETNDVNTKDSKLANND